MNANYSKRLCLWDYLNKKKVKKKITVENFEICNGPKFVLKSVQIKLLPLILSEIPDEELRNEWKNFW